jgi:hypothetical protein
MADLFAVAKAGNKDEFSEFVQRVLLMRLSIGLMKMGIHFI